MRFPGRFVASCAIVFGALSVQATTGKASPELAAYVFPQNATLNAGEVDPHGMTRINYAFANIENGRMVTGFAHDAENFAFLASLRKENPRLTVLVSVGGWLWSGNFSDMALTRESRAVFIQSAVDFIAQYDLDGLDIDWEYPGLPGKGHTFRAEDKQNFTSVLSELRTAFNRASRKMGRRLYLTIAAGASPDFLEHTEMGKVARIVDTVNLMAYDYYVPGGEATTGHNAALLTDPRDPEKASADASVRTFEKAGVPAAKLVLGVPLFGHAWADVAATDHGLYQPGKPAPNGWATFSVIESTMLGHDFTRTWDPVSQVPTLYNAETHTFVSYDDQQSMAAKCRYVHTHRLAGMMVWDLESDDASGTLMKAINACLR
ncbi:MAG TPA: glycoside hydrolase family 18 protein [Terracidiphilus sp.]|jgi:chitinase|nr:glycoside hydrolase family 18 protein [Terracidiphilus sp.]